MAHSVDEVVVVSDPSTKRRKLVLLSKDKGKIAEISGRSSFVIAGSMEHIGDIIKRKYG
jgi:hypothetical protein